ncbi:unnamed protein product [Rhizopus microsporus]
MSSIETENEDGVLQELFRRVMEIDADITQTPVAIFKPNAQACTAYCLADDFELDNITGKLSVDNYIVKKNYNDMLHMSNSLSVGDISLFSNDTVVLWGLNQDRQTDFLDLIRQQQPTLNVIETKEVVEYTTDEDE